VHARQLMKRELWRSIRAKARRIVTTIADLRSDRATHVEDYAVRKSLMASINTPMLPSISSLVVVPLSLLVINI
jgi:hypothetical protein